MTNNDHDQKQIKQTYKALYKAAERMGENNYKKQIIAWKKNHKSIKNFKFTVTAEQRLIVDAMSDLLNNRITCEEAMALLWQYDVMEQRLG